MESSYTNVINMAGRRKHVLQGKRKKSNAHQEPFSKRQKKHLKEFGEVHPADERDTVKKYTKVQDLPENNSEEEIDSTDDSEEETDYNKLVATLSRSTKTPKQIESSEESDSDDDEGDDVEDSDDDVETEEVNSVGQIADSGDSGLEKSADSSRVSEEVPSDDDNSEGLRTDMEEKQDNLEEGEQELALKESDPFTKHFEFDLPEKFVEEFPSQKDWNREHVKIPHTGKAILAWPRDEYRQVTDKSETDLKKLHVKHKLCQQVMECNKQWCGISPSVGEHLTSMQMELFKILNTYQDLYFPERTTQNGEQIRLVYCLHALNHILKTRSRVVAHNAKIKNRSNPVPDEIDYRDQGLTRPKVLIVLPFRDSALKVVNMLTDLLMPKGQVLVSNKKRFQSEYSELAESNKKGLKPEEYEAIFSGNIDDHFRIGVGVAKKTLKLYTDFYSSDIILASPLGIRTMIGGDGENPDSDFLSSIELLIFDQTDIFLMQNWDHIPFLMEHLHLQPKDSHGVDFSRIRMWTLNGWAKYYRQTVVFSSIVCPEINSLVNKSCQNYGGKVCVTKPHTSGTICQIVAQLPQVFQRIDCSKFVELPDTRFEFFIKKVLPHHKDPVMSQTLIFIPSYFDYVRVRNYFVKEEVDFVSICEYSNNKVISKARTRFFHGKAHFMLYTERIHFFRRFKLRGIKHIIFYALPQYPHYYSEICNMLKDPRVNTDRENLGCTVMYSKYEAQTLAAVVGTERASRMLNTEKSVHMFVTGDNS